MRALFVLFFTAAIAGAQIPAQDSRNTNTPNTDTHAKLPEFHSLQQWQERKTHLRKQILSATGLYPMPKATIRHTEIFGRLERADYTIEKVLLETLPGYYLGGNLYRPLKSAVKHPGIVNPHGHWQYGRLENTDIFSGPTLGINLAKQGYVVFAYDMVGYNDTIQTPHKFGNPTEQLWSFGPLQLQLWNSLKATDFVASLPDVDASKLAVTGASGGATQALLLAAVDDRLSFAAPVNMVSAIMQGGDFCENAPGLRVGTNNVEIAAMFAPKPMLIVSATGDWTKNVPREEFPAIQRIYDLYGKRDNVEVVQIDAPHNFNKSSREAVYQFFQKRLAGAGPAETIIEKHAAIEMLQDMLALSNRTLPESADSYAGVFERWKALNNETSMAKDRLQLALGLDWPEKVESKGTLLLTRPGVGDRVAGVVTNEQSKQPPVLVVGPEGVESALNNPRVAALRAKGRRILFIDVFQTGRAIAPRDRSHKHFLTFNLSDDACRVQDILTALSYMHQTYNQPIELVGVGKAAVWAYFAAAVAPIPIKLDADISNFKGRDEDFLESFNVPGIQRAGGLAAARAALLSH